MIAFVSLKTKHLKSYKIDNSIRIISPYSFQRFVALRATVSTIIANIFFHKSYFFKHGFSQPKHKGCSEVSGESCFTKFCKSKFCRNPRQSSGVKVMCVWSCACLKRDQHLFNQHDKVVLSKSPGNT